MGVPESAQAAIGTWLDLLREWNKRIDLTAARTDDELFDLMLADAVFLSAEAEGASLLIPHGARVVDVGVGAGAPGLALALLRPDLKMTLVEPLTKRISFLRTVIGTLGRPDIVLMRDRVEDVIARVENANGNGNENENERPFDVAISRATLAPANWIPLGLTLAPEAWALLARDEPPTLDGISKTADLPYTWPLTKAERRAARYVQSK